MPSTTLLEGPQKGLILPESLVRSRWFRVSIRVSAGGGMVCLGFCEDETPLGRALFTGQHATQAMCPATECIIDSRKPFQHSVRTNMAL